MGVPSLFRWLQSRYPRVTSKVIEIQPTEINGVTIPVDFSLPNPNGYEFDNLYLDMNGIIHPCCRPSDGRPAPETVDDMFIAIFEYIDRLMAMVRPRKLVYMAVDGVAPRAKMNQQRSRRFRAAQDAAMARAVEEEVFARTLEENPFADISAPGEKFDSNCITPGTPFMANLVVALRYYVQHRLNTHPGWRNLKVLMSDASVPGEGEHKVMDYIRRQRCDPHYDPNTHHVLYGLDADLIFLGLATHEPHFFILREDVYEIDRRQRESRGCDRCGQLGHFTFRCNQRPLPANLLKEQQAKNTAMALATKDKGDWIDPYLFFKVSVMREYLQAELYFDGKRVGFDFDFERVLDDWVFICFFVGNDFLPHHPALEIREGAIDLLTDVYRTNLKRMGGYLTEHGILNLERVQYIFEDLARHESDIFHAREHKEREYHDSNRKKQYHRYKDFGYSKDDMDKMLKLYDKVNDLRAAGDLHEAEKIEKKLRKMEVDLANEAEQGIARSESTSKYADDKYMEQQAEEQDEASAADAPVSIAGSGMHVTDIKDKSDNSTLVQFRNATFDVQALAQPLGRKSQSKTEAATAAKRTASEAHIDEEPNELEPPAKKLEGEPTADDDQVDDPMAYVDEPEVEPEDEVEDSDVPDSDVSVVALTKAELLAQNRKFKSGNADLGAPGYIERYYADKFGDSSIDMRRKVGHEYVIGLCWVLHYYIKGCPSWKWYYPYHYAPFASDIMDIDQLGDTVTFELGTPFKPIEQLMGVFPAASKAHIPSVFHDLMTQEDSEIIDFYPTEFVIDLNGKTMLWQGVALLPFIDEKRLLAAMAPLYPLLTEEDRFLNTLGQEVMMVSHANPLFPTMCMAYSKSAKSGTTTVTGADVDGTWIDLPMQQAHIAGQVIADPRACFPGATLLPPFPNHPSTMLPIKNNKAISVVYRHPNYKHSEFVPGLLKGVKAPRSNLSWGEIEGSFRKTRGRNPHVMAEKFTHVRLVPPPGVNVQQERERMAQQRGQYQGGRGGGYGHGGGRDGGYQQHGGGSRNSYEDRGRTSNEDRGRQYDSRGRDNGGYGGYNDRGHRDQYGGGQQQQTHDRSRYGAGGYQGGYQGDHRQQQQRKSWNGGQSHDGYRDGNQGYQGGYNNNSNYDNRGGDRGGRYEGGYNGGNRGHGSGGYSHGNSRGNQPRSNAPSAPAPAPAAAPQFASPSIPAGGGQQHAQMLALQLQLQQQLLAQRQAQQAQPRGTPIGVPMRPPGPPPTSSASAPQQQQQRPPPGNLAWSRNLQRGGGPPSGR